MGHMEKEEEEDVESKKTRKEAWVPTWAWVYAPTPSPKLVRAHCQTTLMAAQSVKGYCISDLLYADS